MNIKGLFAVTLVSTAIFAVEAEGGKPSGGPATSIVYDSPAAAGVDPLDPTPYRIHSDLPLGRSNTYYHNVDSVISQFQSCGCYELSTHASTARSLWVDLSDPVDPTKPAPADILGESRAAYAPGRFISKSGGIDTMKGVGTKLVVPMPFVINSSNGSKYQLRMNSATEPGTTDSVFTCTRVAGADQTDPNALCNAWVAEPVGGKAIARLTKQETIKGKMVVTYYGDHYVTFRLEVTKP